MSRTGFHGDPICRFLSFNLCVSDLKLPVGQAPRAAGRELASKPAATTADLQHFLASWLDSRSSLDHDDHRAHHPIG